MNNTTEVSFERWERVHPKRLWRMLMGIRERAQRVLPME